MTSFQSNSPVANSLYGVANGTTSSSPFIAVLMTRDPNANDFNYPVKQRWINTSSPKEWILTGFTITNGVTSANWLELSDGDALVQFTGGTGTTGFPVNPNSAGQIQLTSNAQSLLITGSTNSINFDIANFSQGTFVPTIQGTTIAGAPVYTSQIGRYQKVGRIATVSYLVSWSDSGGATGNLQCNGLPFTSAGIAGNSTPFLWTDANAPFAPGAGNISVGILNPGTTSWIPSAFNETVGTNQPITIPGSGGVVAMIVYETT